MFSTKPTMGTSVWRNISTPRRTSSRAMAEGVVTIKAAVKGATWVSVICTSPVPGGKSMSSKSSSPQVTLKRNWCIILASMGPRHTTGVPGSISSPMEMALRPCADKGWMRPSSAVGLPSRPSKPGMLGP